MTDPQIAINENYRLVATSKTLGNESNHPLMRYDISNSFEHECKKLEICMELRAQGHFLVTECHFKNGSGIADVFDLNDGIAYEIVKSESDKSIQNKKDKYPVRVIKVKV